MDDSVAGLLDGLEGDELAARRSLLALLLERGFTPDELVAAAREDRLVLLPVEQVLSGRYTLAEVAERSGAPAELILRLHHLQGLGEPGPNERAFAEGDIEAARATVRLLSAGLDEAALGDVARVLGETMSRLSATVTAAFASSFLRPGDTEDAVAVRFAELADQLSPTIGPVLQASFDAHVRQAIGRGMIGQDELRRGNLPDAVELTVAFADLVGFTRLGGEIDALELGTVAGRLGELATDVAAPPVRLVKTIGDAALFVSADPGPLIAAALRLVELAGAAELPSLRVGASIGPTLVRAGDLFGHNVNLASRVTGIARPDSVLCTQALRDTLPDAFDWSYAGSFRLKGVHGAVPLHRARTLSAEPADEVASRPSADRRRRRASR